MGYPNPPTIAVEAPYRIELRRVFGSPAFKHGRSLSLLAWSPDEASLLLLDHDQRGRLHRWDARLGRSVETTEVSPRPAKEGHRLGASGAVVRAATRDRVDPAAIELWDLARPGFLGVLTADGVARRLEVSWDGRVVVVARGDGRSVARALPGGERLVEASGWPLAVSPDGSAFVTTGSRGARQMEVWSTRGAPVVTLGPPLAFGVDRALFSGDGRTVLLWDIDGSVRCYEPGSADPLWTARPHRSEIIALARSPDGATYFTLCKDQRLCAITARGELRWAVALAPWRDHRCAAQIVPSPSGSLVAVNETDRTLRVFDAATGAERSVIDGHLGKVRCVAVSPDGRLVASGGDDCHVRVNDVAAGDTLWVLEAANVAEWYWAGVWSVEFLRDRHSLITCAAGGGVRRWGLARGFEEGAFASGLYPSATRSAPDGSSVLALFFYGGLQRWSEGAGGPDWTLPRVLRSDRPYDMPDVDVCRGAAYGPDASWVVAVRGPSPSRVETLDALTGERIGEPAVLRGRFVELAETDAGPVSVAADGDELVLTEEWGERRERVVREPTEQLRHARLSADRRWLVVASRQHVSAWDLARPTARLAGRIDLAPLDDALTALALSLDGAVVAIGTRRGCVLTFALDAGGA